MRQVHRCMGNALVPMSGTSGGPVEGHGQQLADLRTSIVQMEGRIGGRFEQVDRRFEQVDRRFEQMDGRLDRMERRLDETVRWQIALQVTMFAVMVAAILARSTATTRGPALLGWLGPTWTDAMNAR